MDRATALFSVRSHADAHGGKQEASQRQWTMPELFERLHTPPAGDKAAFAVWNTELHELHGRLHERIVEAQQCPVCGKEGGARLRANDRRPLNEWDVSARCKLWTAIQTTVREHGVRWSAWQPIVQALPETHGKYPARTMYSPEQVRASIQERADGKFAWGLYVGDSPEAIISEYTQVCEYEKSGINRGDAWKQLRHGRRDQGTAVKLQPPGQIFSVHGRIWSVGSTWTFQDDVTGFQVQVPRAEDANRREDFARRDRLLWNEMRKRREQEAKDKQKRERGLRAKAAKTDGPQNAGDMEIVGKDKDGKLRYRWIDSSGARYVEVLVTPREKPQPTQPDASDYQRKKANESTADCALRKMKEKIARLWQKAAKGERERIVARTSATTRARSTTALPSAREHAEADPLQALKSKLEWNDTASSSLTAGRQALEYLQSFRLLHCKNCDEE